MKYENGRSRLHDLKYTHIIRHRGEDGKVYDFLAANVRKTGSHVIYESENAWNQVLTTSVAYGNILAIKEIEEDGKK